ncbi:hypothetical protein SprV_0200597600 [Sparganum proliferum]
MCQLSVENQSYTFTHVAKRKATTRISRYVCRTESDSQTRTIHWHVDLLTLEMLTEILKCVLDSKKITQVTSRCVLSNEVLLSLLQKVITAYVDSCDLFPSGMSEHMLNVLKSFDDKISIAAYVPTGEGQHNYVGANPSGWKSLPDIWDVRNI